MCTPGPPMYPADRLSSVPTSPGNPTTCATCASLEGSAKWSLLGLSGGTHGWYHHRTPSKVHRRHPRHICQQSRLNQWNRLWHILHGCILIHCRFRCWLASHPYLFHHHRLTRCRLLWLLLNRRLRHDAHLLACWSCSTWSLLGHRGPTDGALPLALNAIIASALLSGRPRAGDTAIRAMIA